MYTKGEHKWRLFSTVANSIYVVYGILIQAFPLVIGCSIAVLLHAYRLYQLHSTTLISDKEGLS